MRNISPEMLNHIEQSDVLQLSLCMQITTSNNEEFYYTSFDKNLTIDNNLYKANPAILPKRIISKNDLRSDTFLSDLQFDDDEISKNDILSGKFNNAKITIFLVNHQNINWGKVILRTGYLGDLKVRQNKFEFEVEGLSSKLNNIYGNLYSTTCRANFADNKCKLDLNNFKELTNVNIIHDEYSFSANALNIFNNNHFNQGFMRFLTGKNKNLTRQIKKSYSDGKIELITPFYFELEINDQFEIFQGCDKSFSTCKNRFNNVLNFRGEPYLPGTNQILRTA